MPAEVLMGVLRLADLLQSVLETRLLQKKGRAQHKTLPPAGAAGGQHRDAGNRNIHGTGLRYPLPDAHAAAAMGKPGGLGSLGNLNLAKPQQELDRLKSKMDQWVGRQHPYAEVGLATLGGSVQGAMLGGFMGVLTKLDPQGAGKLLSTPPPSSSNPQARCETRCAAGRTARLADRSCVRVAVASACTSIC